jgi:uncharacterized protein (UPF0332 family)/predicted nucleotidyltransferase
MGTLPGAILSDFVTFVSQSRTMRRIRESQAVYLSEGERRTLEQFLERLEAHYSERVKRVIFFGSKARGNAEPWSDMDLLVVGDVSREGLHQAAEGLETDDGVPLLPLHCTPDEYRRQQRLKLPLYVNIRREGVELWDENAWLAEAAAVPLDFVEGEPRRMDEPTRETINLYLERARRDVQAATDLQSLGYVEIAVSRAYYAAFYALTAALYAVNVVRRKHSGLKAALSEFLVRPGLIEKEFKEIYERLFEQRNVSDYRPLLELGEAQAHQLLDDSRRFVARVERFLRERGALE